MTTPWEILPLGLDLDAAQVGAKAARLGQALAAGLPVPPGFVIPVRAQEPLSQALLEREEDPERFAVLYRTISNALDALSPPPWVVRTSSPEEDGAAVTLAGAYLTELGLASTEALLEAAARCYARLGHPTVTALRRALRLTGAPPAVALLMQPQVTPMLAGVLFTRDPSEGPGSSALVAEWVAGSTTAVTSGLASGEVLRWRRGAAAPPVGALGRGPGLPAGLTAAWLAEHLGRLADSAESLIGDGADLEWALTPDHRLWLLQLRPITAWAPRLQNRQRPLGTADGAVWRQDREHNPLPLSPLHAALVTRLDARLDLPFRMRVQEAFLVTAPRSRVIPDAADGDPPLADLEAWWASEASPSLEEALTPLEEGVRQGQSLPLLLPAFERFFLRYAGEIGPILARARERLGAPLREAAALGDDLPRLEQALTGVVPPLSAWLHRLASLVRTDAGLSGWLKTGQAPPMDQAGAKAFEDLLAEALGAVGTLPDRWDLASPTLAERPGILRVGAARLAALPQKDASAVPARSPLGLLLQIEEEDDLAFAKALGALRRAALADGVRLAARGQLDDPGDIFLLDLDALEEALARPDHRPYPARQGTAAHSAAPGTPGLQVLWGVGCGGGVVEGRVIRPGSLENPCGPEAPGEARSPSVLVCEALIPTAAAYLASAGVSAVVTDHGGLLSHGAILARELGIPAVVGTGDATARLHEGAHVRVDADLGLVCWPGRA